MYDWQGERLYLLRMRTVCCSHSNILAFALSLMAHAGLIIVICIGGIAQSGNAFFSDSKSASIVIVEMGKAKEVFTNTDYRSDAPKSTIMVDSMFADSAQIRKNAVKARSIFPALLPATPFYFSAKDLTQRPLVVHDVPADLMLVVPDVPAQAAILQILINEYGEIDQVIVEDSLLPEAAQKMVVDTFSKIRFRPGEINEVPVKSQLRIEVMLENINVEN